MFSRYLAAVLYLMLFLVSHPAWSQQGNPWAPAYAAEKAQNYTEAGRFQQIYNSGPRVDDRATAALHIAMIYEKGGTAVPLDYATAAQWFQRSIAAGDSLSGNSARLELGRFYAWGVGVPQNRAMARQLFVQAPPSMGEPFIDLLDNNLLPRPGENIGPAMAKLYALKQQQQQVRDAQQARDDATRVAAAAAYARTHPSPPSAPTASAPAQKGCSFGDVMYTMPWMMHSGGGMMTGIWAGNGCR